MKVTNFMTEDHQMEKDWISTLGIAVGYRDLRRKTFRALGKGKQAILAALT